MRDKTAIRGIIKGALQEDIGKGDITTFLCVPPGKKAVGTITAKQKGVLCGMEVTREVFKIMDSSIRFKALKKDGHKLKNNEPVARIRGDVRSILTAERTAINFLSMLSGVASFTNLFVEKIKGTKARIRDTRKTTPLLRFMEKYAVEVGGGLNHRKGLWDGILIKDNHLKASGIIRGKWLNRQEIINIFSVVKGTTKYELEIEVENFKEFKEIISHTPDIVLLDNFDIGAIRKSVLYRDKYYPEVKLEASGRVNLSRVHKIARTGVDFIAIGSITHSSQSVDFSLEIDE